MNIAVCDDQLEELKAVESLLRVWQEQQHAAVRLHLFHNAGELLEAARKERFTLYLLDVMMPGTSGMAAAREIRTFDSAADIVFLTSSPGFAYESYGVQALEYLLKPITREKLFPVLDRAVEHLRRNERALLIASQGETVRIPLYEIRYVESRLNYVTVHAAREYRFKMPLKEIEGMLDGRFFRAGRSLLISLARIRRIARGEVELLDGEILPLPRGAYEPLNRAFIEYF